MSENAVVAESKSAVGKLRGITYGKKNFSFTPSQYHTIKSMEQDRQETQTEISKLTLIIEDQSIELTDQEILEINEEINRLYETKRQIEVELLEVSDGKVNYGSINGAAALFKYFGRAKDVRRKQQEEEERESRESKRKVFDVTEISESNKEDIVREVLSKPAVNAKPAKKTRFDEDADED